MCVYLNKSKVVLAFRCLKFEAQLRVRYNEKKNKQIYYYNTDTIDTVSSLSSTLSWHFRFTLSRNISGLDFASQRIVLHWCNRFDSCVFSVKERKLFMHGKREIKMNVVYDGVVSRLLSEKEQVVLEKVIFVTEF